MKRNCTVIPAILFLIIAFTACKKTNPGPTGCNTDGSIYALLNVNQTYQLTIAGAGGEKNYGAFSTNTPNQRYAVTLNCLRNINGTYYAVATPTYGGSNYLGQHLDVVKLVL